jgi:hypothetical protein
MSSQYGINVIGRNFGVCCGILNHVVYVKVVYVMEWDTSLRLVGSIKMRDLRKYPVTREEIRETLRDGVYYLRTRPFKKDSIVGDIRLAALLDALEQLEQYWSLQDYERI